MTEVTSYFYQDLMDDLHSTTFGKCTDQEPHSYLFSSPTKHGYKPVENFALFDIFCIVFSGGCIAPQRATASIVILLQYSNTSS